MEACINVWLELWYGREGEGLDMLYGWTLADSIASHSTNSLPVGSDTPDCSRDAPYELYGGPFVPGEESEVQEIAYTYSVYWRESKTTFATRWDHYLRIFDPRIHALSLVNSVVIALFRV
jgi:transmembrane 9 superfamily protein 2/4